MTLVLGIDPGKMTGWAVYDTLNRTIVDVGQLDRDEFVDYIVPRLEDRSRPPLEIACERFTISGGTVTKSRGDENWSIEQIGILRHWARRFGHGFKLQSVGDAKKFAPNDRLKLIGWYVPGRGHANDALRHTLLYIADEHRPELEHILTTGQGGVVGSST